MNTIVLLAALATTQPFDHYRVHASMWAAHGQAVQAQRAKTRARHQARLRRLAAINEARLNRTPLDPIAESRWKRHYRGGKQYKAGNYTAVMNDFGFVVKVTGKRPFTTRFHRNLDAAVDEAVRVTGDLRPPIIPGYTPPGLRGTRNVKVADDAGLPFPQVTEDDNGFLFEREDHAVAVWRCIEKGRENITITLNLETEIWSVQVGGNTVVDDLPDIDAAIKIGHQVGRPGFRAPKPRSKPKAPGVPAPERQGKGDLDT